MKKIISFIVITLISFQFYNCKKGEKNKNLQEKNVVKDESPEFSLNNATNSVNFTAYKTTKKVPVKGLFKEIEITSNNKGKTIQEAIDGSQFKIPVSSLETNDSSRNGKIQDFFFKVMKNTMTLKGKIILNDDKNGVAELTMNGITKNLPFEYTIKDKTFSMKATMNLDNWNAQDAIASLNKICKDLHKGADGISKTWNEVSIEVNSIF